jgi:hypothetical protein
MRSHIMSTRAASVENDSRPHYEIVSGVRIGDDAARSLRLVRSRRAGRLVYYALDDNHIRQLLQQGRSHVEETSSHAGGASPERT